MGTADTLLRTFRFLADTNSSKYTIFLRNWQKCSVIYLISGTIHYLCDVFAVAESPLGWKRARYMYIKGVTERFGFDALESRKFKQLVKNKATGTSHGMFIYVPNWSLQIEDHSWGYCIYSSAWGFRRCSFRQSGQCEGLNTWNE